jgi:hypothetical protein
MLRRAHGARWHDGAMRMARRLALLILGDDVEPALRPLLGVNFAGSLAFSGGWSFMGIWAIKELEAGKSDLAIAYVVGSVLAASSATWVGTCPITSAGGRSCSSAGPGWPATCWRSSPGSRRRTCAVPTWARS